MAPPACAAVRINYEDLPSIYSKFCGFKCRDIIWLFRTLFCRRSWLIQSTRSFAFRVDIFKMALNLGQILYCISWMWKEIRRSKWCSPLMRMKLCKVGIPFLLIFLQHFKCWIITGEAFTKFLKQRVDDFNNKFEHVFGLTAKVSFFLLYGNIILYWLDWIIYLSRVWGWKWLKTASEINQCWFTGLKYFINFLTAALLSLLCR